MTVLLSERDGDRPNLRGEIRMGRGEQEAPVALAEEKS